MNKKFFFFDIDGTLAVGNQEDNIFLNPQKKQFAC